MVISKNIKIEPNNLLLVGGPGSGKTRFFIKPFIAETQNARFVAVTTDNELNDLIPHGIIYSEEAIHTKQVEENLFKNNNIILNFNKFDKSKNNILENNLKTIIDTLKQGKNKTTYILIDEACNFNLSFINKYTLNQLNENNVYVIYIVQSIAQLKAANVDFEKMFNTHLFFGSHCMDTLNYYHISISEINFDGCWIYIDGNIVKDYKLDPIDTTKLKLYRIKAGMTQTELASISGVSLRNIRAIEQDIGKIQKLQALNLFKLANALHCSMEDLLEI